MFEETEILDEDWDMLDLAYANEMVKKVYAREAMLQDMEEYRYIDAYGLDDYIDDSRLE